MPEWVEQTRDVQVYCFGCKKEYPGLRDYWDHLATCPEPHSGEHYR